MGSKNGPVGRNGLSRMKYVKWEHFPKKLAHIFFTKIFTSQYFKLTKVDALNRSIFKSILKYYIPFVIMRYIFLAETFFLLFGHMIQCQVVFYGPTLMKAVFPV